MRIFAYALVFLCLCATLKSPVWGQEAAPPLNIPYPGVIQLSVDATDTARHILRVREIIPVSNPGPMTLLYPEWIPANHSAAGRIDELAGLTIRAAGQNVPWTRDTGTGFSFAIDVPVGATELEIEFQIVTPVAGNQGRVVMTPEMLNLQWNKVVLYPAGHYVSQITVAPSVRLPAGWQAALALEPVSNEDNLIRY